MNRLRKMGSWRGLAALVVSGLAYVGTVAVAGPCPPDSGAISGYKFNDLNGDGIDNGEPRLSGFAVTLQNTGPFPVMDTTVTDASGNFSFENLPLQGYQVCEIAPAVTPPWIPTRPECVHVTLFGKNPEAFLIYGNRRESPSGLGCTRTQGYWGSSPAGQALVPVLVPTTLALGTVAYTAAQLDSILDQPVSGNALLILAHQLIAARLNILAGASPIPIIGTVLAADAAIDGLIIPPVGGAFVPPPSPLGQTMVNLSVTLASYNEGTFGVPHCP